MKRLFILTSVSLTISALFFSCEAKKEEFYPEKPGITYCDKVSQIFEFTYPDNRLYPVAKLSYDDRGRVVLVQEENNVTYKFSYSDKRIELVATGYGASTLTLTYYLNNQGRISGTSIFDNDIQYDSEGRMINYKMPNDINGQTQGYTEYHLNYESGNLKEIRTRDHVLVTSFTYYDKPAQELAGMNSPLYAGGVIYDEATVFLIEKGFLGKSSRNLLKNVKTGNFPGSDIQYAYDDKGRVNAKVGSRGFNYQCD